MYKILPVIAVLLVFFTGCGRQTEGDEKLVESDKLFKAAEKKKQALATELESGVLQTKLKTQQAIERTEEALSNFWSPPRPPALTPSPSVVEKRSEPRQFGGIFSVQTPADRAKELEATYKLRELEQKGKLELRKLELEAKAKADEAKVKVAQLEARSILQEYQRQLKGERQVFHRRIVRRKELEILVLKRIHGKQIVKKQEGGKYAVHWMFEPAGKVKYDEAVAALEVAFEQEKMAFEEEIKIREELFKAALAANK